MEHAEKLSPAQAAAMLEINPRTLRRWSLAFAESLSKTARRKGQKRFYTSADLTVLYTARDFLSSGLTLAEVAKKLPTVDIESISTALTLPTEINIALGEVRERTRHLDLMTNDHDQRLKDLESELARLKWERLPFWKRLRTAPPE